ncbi:amino acid ABC transporter permease [Roseomonas nepalensis]|uniref:Amino acid ABC transporter permease n=1 Tax=Muricoccus nepalensis TaxID=1854500 RepID=A0A502G7C6_9PROT|nr:amino acid ABC transporter permease [Roseomonas nepalensis]TPG57768.1 amino acid ABC transporter permease [Roseomonas nepalensis]
MRSFGTPEFLFMLRATQWTVALSLIAYAGGGALGLVLAFMRVSGHRLANGVARAWILLFQCTPLLMLLFLVFFGLALAGHGQNAYFAVTVALSCYAGAYFGEIWRGAIEAVPQGQWQASAALGFSRAEQFRHVIVPQSLRIATPPTVGFMVQVVKNTSLASIIGFQELTQASQFVNNLTFQPISVYLVAAALYFILCFPLTLLSRRLEKRLHVDRPAPLAA